MEATSSGFFANRACCARIASCVFVNPSGFTGAADKEGATELDLTAAAPARSAREAAHANTENLLQPGFSVTSEDPEDSATPRWLDKSAVDSPTRGSAIIANVVSIQKFRSKTGPQRVERCREGEGGREQHTTEVLVSTT